MSSCLGLRVEGSRVWGLRVEGFRGSGFSGLGFRIREVAACCKRLGAL